MPRLDLPNDEVHVWRVGLDLPDPLVDRAASLLAPDEHARAARFVTPTLRARFATGRAALRIVLGRYLGIDADQVAFRYEVYGKPELACAEGEDPLRFNLAHSHNLALIAVARGRALGVDLEQLRPIHDADRIVSRFFSPREHAEYLALPEPRRAEAFLRGWVRKEAYIKAIGEGLTRPLDQFAVTIDPAGPPRLLDVMGLPDEPSRWTLLDLELEPADGFIAALAVQGAKPVVQQFDFAMADDG